MKSDYSSQRPINPLPQQRYRSPPRATLISSTRNTVSNPVPKLSNKILVPKTSTGIIHPRQPMGNAFQRQLKSYGHLGPGLKPFSKSPRKFAEFSAGEEVVMGRATAPTLTVSQSHHANLESASTQVVTPRDYLPPVKTSSSMDSNSTSAGLPKNQSPKDEVTPSKLQHPSTFPNSKSLSTPLQQPENSESDASASNWHQALLSGCVVGVAAVAVLTGYACCTVIRGAVNVGQFIYENRENIQQTCTACTQAVQSTYNAAKRRMVSVPRLPVGVPMHRPRNHKAAAGSVTPFGSAENRNSHRTRHMQLHQHCHLTEWKVSSTVLSLKFHQSLIV